jgi:hypothetical protein
MYSNPSRETIRVEITVKKELNNILQNKRKIFSSVHVLLVFSVFISLAKLLLISGQNFFAIKGAVYDDSNFLYNASYLVNGSWLGPFDHLTLIKGPFYPLWLATNIILHISPFYSQHLLYIASCYVFVIAVRPILQKPIALFIIFVALLFNPMSYCAYIADRVLREGIYPALTIFVLSGIIGLMVRYNYPLKNVVLWSMSFGLTLSAFWLTREEGVWILPSILVIMSFTAMRIYRAKLFNRAWRLIALVLPFIFLLVSTLTVAAINKSNYGIFTTCELKSSNFLDAYGALTRVKPINWRPMVPVPRETRQKLYELAPSFAELKQYLDEDVGPYDWVAPGCRAVSVCDDYAGGWFIWAFRDAVMLAGYYQSTESSEFYYRRLASEINTACDEKKLDCGPARSTLMSPWHAEYTRPLFNTFGRAAIYLAELKGFNASHSINWTREVILSKSSNFLLMADQKIAFLNLTGNGYQLVVPTILILSLLAYIVSTTAVFRKRTFTDFYIINSVTIIAICARLLILSLIEVSSFPAIDPQYLSSAYPLVLIFSILSLLDCKQTVFEKDR